MAVRVVQWTTGNVGRRSARAVIAHPGLDLVGCYAWSPDKVGRDAGELCGVDHVGIAATDDVNALLALRPDCVVYTPMWSDVEELVRILEAGVNVVSTAAFINGRGLGPERDRIVAACERGGSSMFGSGVSPGFVELLAIVAANVCDRIDKVTVIEEADTSLYDSPETELPAGFARPIDDPELPAMARRHGGLRRGSGARRRCARRRARRDRLRARVRADHRTSRPRFVADSGRSRGRSVLPGSSLRPGTQGIGRRRLVGRGKQLTYVALVGGVELREPLGREWPHRPRGNASPRRCTSLRAPRRLVIEGRRWRYHRCPRLNFFAADRRARDRPARFAWPQVHACPCRTQVRRSASAASRVNRRGNALPVFGGRRANVTGK